MTVRSPSGRKWTYDDYAAIPPDLSRHEIIDGEHFANPAPNVYHQAISKRLGFQLYRAVEESGLGVIYFAPIDVQLSEHDIVQPDLVVVLEENREIVTPAKIVGPPDLAIEILSPGTRHHDATRKKDCYRRAGVPEIWIVDPDRRTVDLHRLTERDYELVATEGESIAWTRVTDVTVDLTPVW